MKYLLLILTVFAADSMAHAKSNSDARQKSDATADAMAGMKLDAKQVSDLEGLVAKNPDDLSARTKLLGFYFMARHNKADANEGYRKHVLWIIKNRPEAEIAGTPFCSIDAILDADGYHDAKQLWLEQTRAHEKNAPVVGHAAQFFLVHDQAIAERLLKQAQNVEPTNPAWSDGLGHLYELQNSKGSAAKALAEFEKAQTADASDASKFYRLVYLAKSAFAAGEIEKASNYAEELLKAGVKHPKDWNYGNSIHCGNNVLGRIALKKGNVKKADEFLLKAGQTPGSPQLNSFGPNMSLANELLEAGEKDTVLQYFEFCRKFWKSGGDTLDDWSKLVKAGQIPQFGANLVY